VDRRQLTLVVALAAAVAGALWLRHYLSPAQVVRRQLAEAVAAFENEKLLGVMPKISRSYSDPWGGSYEALGGHLQSVMDAWDDLAVDLEVTAAEVGEGEVRLAIVFVVGGSDSGRREAILGTAVDPCRATLLWVEEQPGWRLRATEELDIPELRDELQRRREP
jgi:hypothetical protein